MSTDIRIYLWVDGWSVYKTKIKTNKNNTKDRYKESDNTNYMW